MVCFIHVQLKGEMSAIFMCGAIPWKAIVCPAKCLSYNFMSCAVGLTQECGWGDYRCGDRSHYLHLCGRSWWPPSGIENIATHSCHHWGIAVPVFCSQFLYLPASVDIGRSYFAWVNDAPKRSYFGYLSRLERPCISCIEDPQIRRVFQEA